jgi:glutathione-regulated potassium-efflux system ancillary protein KefG
MRWPAGSPAIPGIALNGVPEFGLFFLNTCWDYGRMKLLVLFAHPRPSGSIVQRAMLAAIAGLEHVTIHDLYAAYPDFEINVKSEQERLMAHDVIVLQHPFYWYSSPAILKEWQDLVLENGWAYGPGGTRLAGKFLMNAISTGGSSEAYRPDGRNRFAIETLLAPFNQTAHLCSMAFLEPFIINAGRKMPSAELTAGAEAYRDLIVGLRDGRIDPLQHLCHDYTLPANFKTKATS